MGKRGPKPKPKPKPRGRPSKYTDDMPKRVLALALLGLRDEDMALAVGISVDTFNQWKKKHPEFSESLKRGKMDADTHIAQSLYHRARGYSHPEDKIFCNAKGDVTVQPTTKHYPPDTTAAIFWLKNRHPELWRDVQNIDANVNSKDTHKVQIEFVDSQNPDTGKA